MSTIPRSQCSIQLCKVSTYWFILILFALLETVFHVADIFSDFGYYIDSIYFLLFFPLIIIFFFCTLFVMANFLLCSTCLLCSMYDYLGRGRGCMQCVQSIVCLRLFRGHTCVCSSCRMPEWQLVALSAPWFVVVLLLIMSFDYLRYLF